MFDSTRLSHVLSKEAFKEREAGLRNDLLDAQRELLERGTHAVMVLVNGVDGAGKGEVLNRLYEWLDPRFLETAAIDISKDIDNDWPPQWYYWRKMPAKGRVSIVLGSWYHLMLRERALGNLDKDGFARALVGVREYEAMLEREGVKVLKLWLHVDIDEAERRFRKKGKEGTFRRPLVQEWADVPAAHDRRRLYEAAGEVAQLASPNALPWTIVPAADGRYRDIAVGQALLALLRGTFVDPCAGAAETAAPAQAGTHEDSSSVSGTEEGSAAKRGAPEEDAKTGSTRTGSDLKTSAEKTSAEKAQEANAEWATPDGSPEAGSIHAVSLEGKEIDGLTPLPRPSIASTIDLTKTADRDTYSRDLREEQRRIFALTSSKAFRKRGLVVVFEGNDAAGKGGCIRRIRQALDPRDFQVHATAAPSQEERSYPYLWRFWRAVPERGTTAIFDRSWYGRVLVERVEGFCTPEDWMRAYGEINAFERQLTHHGYIVIKFWLAITPEEQLRRFEARAETPYKQFKITDEDWRNRDKWNLYDDAMTDMIDRTSTTTAPWTLVPAVDKRYARLKVLGTVARRVEAALD